MTDEIVETFPYGTTRSSMDEGQISVIYGNGDMSRSSITSWANVIIDTINRGQPGARLYLMLDLTSPRQGFTPYTRIVVEMIYKSIPPDREIIAAVVLRDSILIQIITGLVNRMYRNHPGIKQHMFTDKEAALHWLREMRPK